MGTAEDAREKANKWRAEREAEKAAEIAVWALPYGYNMGQPIESCAPDRVIPDISPLLH